jgi:hypothetical protein
MLKIFKIAVTGFDYIEDVIGLNTKTRATMGYTAEGGISVKIEKVILPSVPTNESVELREQHTTAEYETILERVFTTADFPKTSDLIRWHVDYDAEKNEFVGPFNALELTKSKITNSQSGRKIARFIKERYNENLIPLFALDNVYKNATDFDASVLTFYVDENGNDLNDTILTGEAVDAQPVTQQEKEFWLITNVNTNVIFEVLDTDGKIVSSSAQKSAKSEYCVASPIPMTPMNLDPDNTMAEQIIADGGNQFKVSLPVSDSYKIRIMYQRHLHDLLPGSRTMPVTFDVNCVNGICNKSRSVAKGYDPENPDALAAAYKESHVTGPRPSLVGVDVVTVNTFGLSAGDYIKLKLDLGEYKSYAELWIELV